MAFSQGSPLKGPIIQHNSSPLIKERYYIYTHIVSRLYVYLYMHMYICVYMYIHTYVYTCVYMYVYI